MSVDTLIIISWWCDVIYVNYVSCYRFIPLRWWMFVDVNCWRVVDEFLTWYWRQLDGVCMYWKMMMLIVDDLLLNVCIKWVVCSSIHKSDSMSILAMTGYIYPCRRWLEYFVFILTMTTIQMYLRWRLWGDRYHMHVELCLRHIA